MKDLTTISTDLFNKVRSRFSNVKLGDQAGVVITDPAKARFFDLDYTHEGDSLGHVNIKIDDKSLTVIYNESMVEGQHADARKHWYDFLKELRMFAKSNMLNFDTRDITKTNLDKRDYEYLAQENGDTQMSESKLWGTSKTSFQDMGEAKIIVKHSQPVNYSIPAGRTMHIESIYIENAQGERFRYPHRHLNGARAMAVHVANGGTVYDNIGTHISGLSEELAKLRQFKNYTQRNGLQEALSDISDLVLTRISDIKEQISKLQRQSYYSEFAESFAPTQDLPIPEETVNTWVDALTIRTFNEELKSVFPFIYKLTNQPKEIGYEDLVGEGKGEYCDACDRPKKECVCDEELEEHNHLEDFEQHLDAITSFDYTVPAQTDVAVPEESTESEVTINGKVVDLDSLEVDGIDHDDHPDYSDAYFSYGQFVDGSEMSDDELETLTDQERWLVHEMVFDRIYETGEPMQQVQQPSTRDIIEFIVSMYDQQTGTFPKGEEGVKIAVEKRFGDNAGMFADQVVERLSAKSQPNFE